MLDCLLVIVFRGILQSCFGRVPAVVAVRAVFLWLLVLFAGLHLDRAHGAFGLSGTDALLLLGSRLRPHQPLLVEAFEPHFFLDFLLAEFILSELVLGEL